MGTPFIGEIRMTAFTFAPKGWALCNGQAMAINQNQPLFALLGTTFGGDGRTNFNLPDLRGRVPTGNGSQPAIGSINWGQVGGEELHTLVTAELPAHTHTAQAGSAGATLPTPSGNFWPTGLPQYVSSTPNSALAVQAIAANGGGQGHENRSPYSVINFIIALQGIFPSRN